MVLKTTVNLKIILLKVIIMVRVLITERMIICIREIVIKTITIVIKMNCEVKSIENKETLIRTRNWSNKNA